MDAQPHARPEATMDGRDESTAYRLLADRMTDYVSIEGSDRTLAYASPSVERLLGYRPEELIGTDARRLVHPDDLLRAVDEVAPVLQQGDHFSAEVRLRRKDGTYVWTEVTGQGVLTTDGTVERQVSARDISARKAAEDALRSSEAMLRAVVDQSTDLIAIAGIDRVLYASRSTVDALGFELADRPLHEFWPIVHPADRPAALARFSAAWERPGTRVGGEVRIACRDGWRIYESVTTNMSHEPRIGGLLLTARDVTARRNAEQLLLENERRMHSLEIRRHEERVAEQLRRAQQLDTVGRLAAGAAHDFGNLLGVVANCSQFASRLLAPDHPARAELEVIDGAVERAAELIQQLLLFGNPYTITAARFDVSEVVTDVLALLDTTREPKIDFEYLEAEGHTLEVVADRRRVERALVNLIVNACNAMPDGGTVTVRCELVHVMDRDATELGVTPGRYACITIRDTGAGMPPAVLQRAFEPFYTTAPAGEGTGLGLSTAKDAIERAGGAITLSSREGEGTTATVLLPVAV
jgi:two-component system cell cycle sensor histidine kinase/response regulator CckA